MRKLSLKWEVDSYFVVGPLSRGCGIIIIIFTPRAYVQQEINQSVYLSSLVVVSMKIARSRDLDIKAIPKYNDLFELLKNLLYYALNCFGKANKRKHCILLATPTASTAGLLVHTSTIYR